MTRRMRLSFLACAIMLFTPIPIPAAEADVPVHAMFLAFGGMLLALGIVSVVLSITARSQREKQKLIEQFIEKGQEVPPELMDQFAPPGIVKLKHTELTRRRDIRRGIWLLCWGLGLGLVAYATTGQLKNAAWSLLFLILGGGSFVNGVFFSGRKNSDQTPEKDA